MPYDERWLREIPTEAEIAGMRLKGLAYLCTAWTAYRTEVGDPGPEGEGYARRGPPGVGGMRRPQR